MSINKKAIDALNKSNTLPDTQGLLDTRNLPINKVGIKDILHPVVIKQRSGGAIVDLFAELFADY